MKKYAVCIIETLTRTVIVEVDDNETYEDAEEKVYQAYNNCYIVLNADNSAVDFECEDDTENYMELFEEDFDDLPVDIK